jgi:hypothetical protein
MFMRSRLGRLIMWMGLAAALTYFFDPDRGEIRRRQLRMRLERMRSAGEETIREARERTTRLDAEAN